MRLALCIPQENEIFFEYSDVFSAQYDIIEIVEKRIRGFPKHIEANNIYGDVISGWFNFNGIQLEYQHFIDFDEVLAKNRMIPPKVTMYKAKVIDPLIIPFDQWWVKHCEGNKYNNLVHSTIIKRNSV